MVQRRWSNDSVLHGMNCFGWFFIYSFLGWVLETAAATVKQKKFANRGLVNGPFCVIYGIAALFMTFGLQELRGVWTFFICDDLCDSD